jgi:hypothetical protein
MAVAPFFCDLPNDIGGCVDNRDIGVLVRNGAAMETNILRDGIIGPTIHRILRNHAAIKQNFYLIIIFGSC